MRTFFKDVFEFREAMIVCGNNGCGVGVMGRLVGPNGIRMEGRGNLFGYKRWGITCKHHFVFLALNNLPFYFQTLLEFL